MLKLGCWVSLTALLLIAEFSKGQDLAVREEKFVAKLVKIIAKTQPHNKGITSPLAARYLAAAIADGAKGQTETEFREIMLFPDRKKCRSIGKSLGRSLLKETAGQFRVVVSDKIYIDQKFKVEDEFKEVAKSYYYTEVENVNFANTARARRVINQWILNKSLNKVYDIIHANQINKQTKMVLLSNLRMKGKWEIPFPPSKTTQKTFYSALLHESVQMMNSVGTYKFKHCGYLKAKFLEIPFKNSSLCTTFILPDSRDGIQDVFKNIELYLKPHDLKRQRVKVSLPKFSVKTEHDYKELLEGLGVKKLFNAGEADLSGISKQKGLSVDVFQQKIFINVTESGIGTGAVKSGEVKPAKTEKPPKQTFNADHPFFFYIKDAKFGVFLLTGNYI